jgi:hypothetical protein
LPTVVCNLKYLEDVGLSDNPLLNFPKEFLQLKIKNKSFCLIKRLVKL